MKRQLKRHLNLMSQQARVRECVRTRWRHWSRAWAGIGAVLGVAALLTWWPAHRASQHRLGLESQYETIRLMKAQNKSLRRQIERLHAQEKLVLELADSIPMIAVLGSVGQAVGDTNGKVFVEELAFEMEPRTNVPAGSSVALLDLEGLGTDPNDAETFVDSLQAAIPFASVHLEATRAAKVNRQPMHAFTIRCSF